MLQGISRAQRGHSSNFGDRKEDEIMGIWTQSNPGPLQGYSKWKQYHSETGRILWAKSCSQEESSYLKDSNYGDRSRLYFK